MSKSRSPTSPEDTYPTKLETALLADAPDLAAPYGTNTFFSFTPLNKIFKDRGINVSDYNAVLTSFCGWDGKLYGIGTTVGNMALFYNKDMFDAAGLPYPSATAPMTFDDYATIAGKLTKAVGNSTHIWGAGADILQAYIDPAYYLDSTGRKVEVLNDGYLGAVKTIAGMVAAGVTPSSGQALSVGGSDDSLGLQAMFTSGRLAMFIGDNFATDSAEAANMNFGLAPTPIVAGGTAWVPAWTNPFGIPLKSQHPTQAADFLAFLATDGQTIQASFGQMPLLTSVADTWANTEPRKELVQISKLARTGVFNPDQWAWNAPLIDAYSAALRGDPVQPLFADAQPKAQQANDATWKVFDQAVAAAQGLTSGMTTSSAPVPVPRAGRVRVVTHRRGSLVPWLFLSPWIIGFVAFTAIPALLAVGMSFTDWNLRFSPNFVGLGNYEEMLFSDYRFWSSLRITGLFLVLSVPIYMIIGLAAALLLNQKVWGIRMFRTILFLPSVLSGVAVAVLWLLLLTGESGAVNSVLRSLGVAHPPQWFDDPNWAVPALVITGLWTVLGNGAIIYLAGLQNISPTLFEAAAIDGAGTWRPLLECHDPDADADVVLHAAHLDHRGVPGVRHGVHHRCGPRIRRLSSVLPHLCLGSCVPRRTSRLRARVEHGAVPDRHGRRPPAASHPEPLGLLRGRAVRWP